MKVPQLDPERPSAFDSDDTRSPWLLAFLVLVGLLVSAVESGPDPQLWSRAAPLGALYLALMVWIGDRLQRQDPWLSKVAYFAVQLSIMGGISYAFVQGRIFGTEWLLFMPLISQARLLLSSAGSFVVALSSLGLLTGHVAVLGGWKAVPEAIFGISTAVAFVILFTDIAMKESAARQFSQQLSRQLESANRRLSEYAVQAEELAGARERTRVAREIHDSIGHSLTAVHMQLEAARTVFDRDRDKARLALEKAQTCIKEGLTEIRASVSSLRSDPLEGRSLPQALHDLTQTSTDSGLTARLVLRGRQRPITGAVMLTLYRCGQEALTNARKHSRASRVDLELDFGETWGDGIKLRVADDGVGSEAAALAEDTEGAAGFGLLGLRERVRQQSGELHIHTAPGEGLRLDVHLPTPIPADPFRAQAPAETAKAVNPETGDAP